MWQASAIGIDEYNQFAESIKEELLNSNLSALQLFVCFMAGTGPEDMLLKAKIFIKDIVIAWLGLLECNEPLILVPFIATGECKSADQFWDSFDEFYEDLVDVIKPFTRIWSQINEYLDNLLCARPLIRWELNKFDILLGWRLSQLVCLYSGTFVEYIGEIVKSKESDWVRSFHSLTSLEGSTASDLTVYSVGSTKGQVNQPIKSSILQTAIVSMNALGILFTDEGDANISEYGSVVSIGEDGSLTTDLGSAVSIGVQCEHALVAEGEVKLLVNNARSSDWAYVKDGLVGSCNKMKIPAEGKILGEIKSVVGNVANLQISSRILVNAAVDMLSMPCLEPNERGIVEQIHLLARNIFEKVSSGKSRGNIEVDDPFIVLLGDSKMGISTFCNRLLGENRAVCSDGLLPTTQICTPYHCHLLNCDILDTPGFSFTRNDEDTFALIQKKCQGLYLAHIFVLHHHIVMDAGYVAKMMGFCGRLREVSRNNDFRVTLIDTHMIPKKEADIDVIKQQHNVGYLSQNLFFKNYSYLKAAYHAITLQDVEGIIYP